MTALIPKLKTLVTFLLCAISIPSGAQIKGSASDPHLLNPSSKTVVWGHYWSETTPVLRIRSGEFVKIRSVIGAMPETLERAGLPAARMEKELIAAAITPIATNPEPETFGKFANLSP